MAYQSVIKKQCQCACQFFVGVVGAGRALARFGRARDARPPSLANAPPPATQVIVGVGGR